MSTYVVVYDPKKAVPSRVELADIDGWSWQRLSDAIIALDVDLDIDDVYLRLSPAMTEGGFLHVLSVSRPWLGCGDGEVMKWLSRHLHW